MLVIVAPFNFRPKKELVSSYHHISIRVNIYSIALLLLPTPSILNCSMEITSKAAKNSPSNNMFRIKCFTESIRSLQIRLYQYQAIDGSNPNQTLPVPSNCRNKDTIINT
ncbi:hypothetical protein QL285_006916 [Trifolium repens]|nr:hypothetical protein QL285_006916 [Trifolium repens]